MLVAAASTHQHGASSTRKRARVTRIFQSGSRLELSSRLIRSRSPATRRASGMQSARCTGGILPLAPASGGAYSYLSCQFGRHRGDRREFGHRQAAQRGASARIAGPDSAHPCGGRSQPRRDSLGWFLAADRQAPTEGPRTRFRGPSVCLSAPLSLPYKQMIKIRSKLGMSIDNRKIGG